MTWSTMSRRYTCNSDDYPEHLNPFREDNEGDDARKNKFDTIGRRKLKTVLSLTSWTPFPTKKTKPADKDTTVFQRSKFLTMTPKISRGLMERLSQRTNRSKSSAPASNPVPRDQIPSYSDFKIMPRSSREKFAMKVERDERYDAETASYLWSVESSSPTSPGADVECREQLIVTSPGADVASSSTSTTPVSEVNEDHDPSEESKPAKQGARTRKKRRAPLPPPQPVSETQAVDKQDNTSAEREDPPVSSVPESAELPLSLTVSKSTEPPQSQSSVFESAEPPLTLPSVSESPEPPLSLSSIFESAEPPLTLPSVSESPEPPLSLSSVSKLSEQPQSQSLVGLPESPEPPLCSVPDSSPESNGNINLTTETQPETGIGIQGEETLPTSRC